MGRNFYKVLCRIDGRDRYLIWYNNDQDGLIINKNVFIASFPNVKTLEAYAREENIVVNDGVTAYNFDELASWVAQPTEAQIDCNSFLDAWNLFGDVAASVGESGRFYTAIDKRYFKTYQKLFFGCNVPAITPPGEKYIPCWTVSDIKNMVRVFKTGLELLRRVISM